MSRRCAHRLAALLGALSIWAPAPSEAHTRSLSFADWHLDEAGGTVQLRLTPRDYAALSASLVSHPGAAPLDYVMDRVRLSRGDKACEPRDGQRLEAGAARVAFVWRVDCEGTSDVFELESDALFEVIAGHVQLVSVWVPGADRPVERVLSERARSATVGDPEGSGAPATALAFVREGVAHIASGWDHLAFLLLLVVGLGRARAVALAVTGFTLGHSLTLGAAALGFVRPETGAVEVLIAASVLVLAVENVWLGRERGRSWGLPAGLVVLFVTVGLLSPQRSPGLATPLVGLALFTACYFGLLTRLARPARLRLGLAALFGLVHGFGFAGALAGMPLPTGQRVVALASFNLGVELGQLAVVAVALGGLWWLGSRGRATVGAAGAATGAAAGTFWLVARAFEHL